MFKYSIKKGGQIKSFYKLDSEANLEKAILTFLVENLCIIRLCVLRVLYS